jgi:putative redox protein
MTTELSVHAVHQGGMRVLAGTASHKVLMDYPLQPGATGEGLTPLQMLLASLAACSANSVMLILKKMNQPIAGLEVEAHGLRRQVHPTVLTGISLEFLVTGSGVDPAAVARALKLSEEQICPVWNMLKGKTPITTSLRIVEVPAEDSEPCATP